jgi:glycogen(starch) synthase
MRVLLVADFYPPSPGGLEAHVRRLALGLVERGHHVSVVAGAGGRQQPGTGYDDQGVEVRLTGTELGKRGVYQNSERAFHPPWADRLFSRTVEAAVRDFRPDVVHAHGWCQFSAASVCGGRVPLVVTLHDHGLRCPKKILLDGESACARGLGGRCVRCSGPEQGLVKRIGLGLSLTANVKRFAEQVRLFIAVSEDVLRRAHSSVGETPAVVIPNFIDRPQVPARAPDGATVLFVGTGERHKGLDVLLDAWDLVPTGLGELVVVGVEGTRPGVHFAGRMSGDELWRKYQQSSFVVVPSVWPEPCPTVVLEAMSLGRPVIASRIGGMPEMVEHGHTGLLVEPGQPAPLARAITRLLEDPAQTSRMARAALDRSVAFTAPAIIDRIQEKYGDAVATPVGCP